MRKVEKKEINEIVTNAKQVAISSLKNFFRLIDLDSEAFNHIYEIPVKCEDFEGDTPAKYLPDENQIIINRKYIVDRIKTLNQCFDDERKKKSINLDIALTIVHEMIHANRTIMIENGLSAFNIKQKIDDEEKKYSQQNDGYNVDQYMNLLNEIIDKPYIVDFKKLIPVKIRTNEDGSYTVIAYNRITKDYDEFKNQLFNVKMEDSVDEFLHNIGLELNNDEINHEKTNTIYSFGNDNYNQKNVVVNDYYIPYNKSGKLINEFNTTSSHISNQQYSEKIEEKMEDVLEKFENSDGLEESITEVLADIIIMSRDKDKLELDLITDKIFNSKTAEADEKMGAKLIQKMGPDMIRWFMTSVYSEYYDDIFEKFFEERYDDLLCDFNDLYETVMYNEPPNQFSIDEIEDILDEKIR